MEWTRRANGRSGISAPALAMLVASAICGAAQASVVIPMTMTEIADNAGQVIVGEWGMHISDAPTFAEGEKCVLFILPTYRTFPVVGLSQGCFRVQAGADGVERVYNAEREPVKGLGKDGFVQVAARPAGDVRQHLVAENNVRVTPPAKPAAPREEAISLADFTAMIQPIVAASKSHRLAEPAGRPILETPRSGQRLHRAGDPLPDNGSASQAAVQDNPAPRGTGQAAQTQNPPRQPATEKKEGGR